MSAGFDLAVIRAPLKLWISSTTLFALISVVVCMLLCFQQRPILFASTVSMCLRLKRSVSFCLFSLYIALLVDDICCSFGFYLICVVFCLFVVDFQGLDWRFSYKTTILLPFNLLKRGFHLIPLRES